MTNHMFRFFCLCLISSIVFMFCACGDDDDDPSTSSGQADDDEDIDDDADDDLDDDSDDDLNDDSDDDADDDIDDDVDDDVDDDADDDLDDDEDAIYVSKNGDDANPGTSDAPMLTISAAAQAAEIAGKEVRVAQGQYTEAVETSVSIFGGYEDAGWTRDPVAYATFLVADGLNPFQYLLAVESTESLVFSGFTIVNEDNGYAVDIVADSADAPVYFAENIVKGRVLSGGFAYFINNVFKDRFEIDWRSAKSIVVNNLFLSNFSVWMDEAVLVNNNIAGTIYGDFTTEKDGAGRLTLINNNIWNQGLNCLVSAFPNQDPECILSIDDINAYQWLYCTEASGNISNNPLLIDPANGDYHLQAGSPLIDNGTDPIGWYEGDLADYDFEGDARPAGVNWDIGVDEFVAD